MPKLIAILISANRATLAELQTIYSVRDGYDLLEVVAVNSFNERRLRQKR